MSVAVHQTHGAWSRHTDTGEHFLSVNADESWKIWRTPAGDYAMTLHSDEVGYGDDVEYFDTLRQAKREAGARLKQLTAPSKALTLHTHDQ